MFTMHGAQLVDAAQGGGLGELPADAERVRPHHSRSGYPQRRSLCRRPRPVLASSWNRPDHEFWPDDISITDESDFRHGHILGPKQITDVYLLGLAVKNGGRLVTFDRGLPLKAVRGAEARHLVVL